MTPCALLMGLGSPLTFGEIYRRADRQPGYQGEPGMALLPGVEKHRFSQEGSHCPGP